MCSNVSLYYRSLMDHGMLEFNTVRKTESQNRFTSAR